MLVRRYKLPLALAGAIVWAWLAGMGQAAGGPPAKQKPAEPPPQAPAAQPAPAGEYAGAEVCSGCHPDLEPGKLVYHKEIGTLKRFSEWKGKACEACHGPGKSHAEAADPKLIFSFKKAAAARVSQACLKCHTQGSRTSQRAFDAHFRNSVACTNCHTIHAPKVRPLLADAPNNLCVTCHTNVKAEFSRPYRHRLVEGAITCIDCHNQHGTPLGGRTSAQLRGAYGNEIACLKCHADKRGPFTFEHVPVRTEGCTACHEAHGSVNPRMLVRAEVRFMCLECHTTPSIAAAGKTLRRTPTMAESPPAFHDLRSPRFRNCTTCHVRIHGSYISEIFER